MNSISLIEAAEHTSVHIASCGGSQAGRIIPFYQGQSHEALGLLQPEICPKMDLSVSTLRDAFIVIGPGRDGIVFDCAGRAIKENMHFTHTEWEHFTLEYLERNSTVLDQPLVLTIDASWRNYYHWSIMCLGKAMIYNRLNSERKATVLIDYKKRHNPNWSIGFSHDVWGQSLLRSGITEHCVYLNDGIYRVRSLDLLRQSVDQPPFITCFSALYSGFSQISASLKSHPKSKIIIARPHDNRLSAESSDALTNLSKYAGFDFVTLETMSFEDQIATFAAAKLIVAPHGAGLTNMIYASKEAIVVEFNQRLHSEKHLRPWFCMLCSGMNQSYCYIDNDRYTGDSRSIYDRLIELAYI